MNNEDVPFDATTKLKLKPWKNPDSSSEKINS